MKKYLLLIWILAFQALQAQVFPVQVTPQLIPPYSLNLSDYQNAAREQVIVNLLLSDVTESNREVTLKFSMTNTAGFAIESAPVVVGALPVFLNGGIPLRLTNADLQAYFQLQNLRGISPQQYGQPLPDGVYQFCFEVFDRRSGQAISRKSCATAFLVLNDPPFLNVPSRGEAIPQKEPQNIVFQWTPRHLNATNVEYEFTLVEVWDELVDPQTAFLASRPYYQTTTRATTLLYGPGEPALLPDKNYAWRVRAVINDGISQTSVFKNNGYSEIYYFEHNAECAPPLFAISESKTATTQNIRWQQALYQGYNVQYRKKKAYTQTNETKETKRNGKKRKKNKGSKNASYSGIKAVDGGSPWFEIKTFSEQATIFNLEKATTYEFRVGGRCRPNGGFAYGNIQEFTTASSNDQASGYQCGILPNIQINNQEPLERLGVNEVFTAGDFPVTVKFIAQGNRVSGEPGSGAPVLGANGTYSGWGFITVPYLADTRIKVIFNNIKLNSDYQLIEGVVETDYDKDWGDVDDISDELEVLEDVIEIIGERIEKIKNKIGDLFEKSKITEEEKKAYENEVAQYDKEKEEVKEAKDGLDALNEEIKKEDNEEKKKKLKQEATELKDSIKKRQKDLNTATENLEERLNVGENQGVVASSDGYFDGSLSYNPATADTSDLKTVEGFANFDAQKIFSSEEFAKANSEPIRVSIGENKNLIVTHSKISKEDFDALKAELSNINYGYYLWTHYDLEKKEVQYKINFASDYFGNLDLNRNQYVEFFNKILTFDVSMAVGKAIVSASDHLDVLLEEYKAYVPGIDKELISGYSTYDILKLLLEFGRACGEEIKEQKKGTIVPKCLWNHEKYYPAAYAAGFIDGIWEIVDLGVDLAKFSGAWSPLSPIFLTDEAAQIREQTISTLTLIGEIFTTEGALKNAASHVGQTLKAEFSKYKHNIGKFDAEGRYLQGKLVFDIVSLFIGLEELKILAKTGKLTSKTLQGLKKLGKGGRQLVFALGKKLKIDKNKIVTYALNINTIIEIGRFADDGVLIVDDLLKTSTEIVQEIGEITYREGANGVEETAELAIVEAADGSKKLALKLGEKIDDVIESAREFVRKNYGQDFLNQITQKYGKNNAGALAVVVKRFGEEGAELLRKGKSLDDIASELVKERTLYRNIGSQAGYLDNLKKTGEIPSGYTTYFSADKFDDPVEAISKMQLNGEWTDAVWVAEFSGSQLVGKVKFPKAKWNESKYLEVLTRSFPKWGEGGASQFITEAKIKISKLRNLKTGEIIEFSQKLSRSIDKILVNGKIPTNSKGFTKWFDGLTLEEFDLVWEDSKLNKTLQRRIRWPAEYHEWCMVCESRRFKEWGVSMDEVHRFRTKTLELKGTNPKTGEPFAHSIENAEGKIVSGPGSKTFHNELQDIIINSSSLNDFNSALPELIKRWDIDPDLLPPLLTN